MAAARERQDVASLTCAGISSIPATAPEFSIRPWRRLVSPRIRPWSICSSTSTERTSRRSRWRRTRSGSCRATPMPAWTGLITDGPLGTQQAKVRALGLEDRLGCIIYTDALGPGRKKPHPQAYELQETWAQPSGLQMVYIADNPLKDFVTPRGRGWLTVKLARPERVHRVEAPDAAHQAHAEITTVGPTRRLPFSTFNRRFHAPQPPKLEGASGAGFERCPKKCRRL